MSFMREERSLHADASVQTTQPQPVGPAGGSLGFGGRWQEGSLPSVRETAIDNC